MPNRPTRPQDHGAESEPDGSLPGARPPDISQLNTTLLVPRTAVEAASTTRITEHKAALEYLRELQQAVVVEVTDARSRERRAASEELRGIIKRHIQELWSYWKKLDWQATEHEQAMERLRNPD
ncbi:MAG: hypothetical protein ACLQUY_06710 [Ktedonobacterales bacterium]